MATRAAAVREPARTTAPAAASQPAPGPMIAVGGVRMYRMRDGRWIQLPEDMTAADAARLEAEGAEAQKKIVKAPPLGPAPNVRKPAKKEAAKQPPRKGTAKRAPGKGAAQAAAAAAGALLGAVGGSKVAQYLATKALPALTRGVGGLARLKQNEQTHDDGGEKLRKSESAVVNPPSEGQSKSNTGQVETVGDRPAPPVDEQKGMAKLQQSLTQYLPKDMETADNFKRDQKAQRMGSDVLEVVQGDKNAVVGTFGAMTQTPPPAPPEHTPVELPPPEAAPRTAPLNLGQGAVAELQPEHTDVSDYNKQADSKLKEEGVSQQQLDMVDSGELADANKEKKGMEQKAKTEPLAIQQFARQEGTRVDKELAQDEKAGREEMQGRRKVALATTAGRQRGAKSALEKKRDEVATKINGIFKTAQDSVTKKLDALEKESMKRFDDGNAAASKQFEDNVNRELEAYKDDRYSGMFGWARKAKDWLLGMDDLPRVKEIFDTNRATFVKTIDKLVADIAADNKRVIQECRNELADAKKKIQEYVDSLEPGLKGIGKKAAGEMSDKLNDLDQTISKKEDELKNKLKDKQTAAIKAIDQKIEKMKEAMSGALAKLGKLLLWAAKKFFTWALGKFGVALSTIEGIIDKGVAVLKAIFTQPIQFVKNLVRAAITGFENFGKNFLTHLKNAVFEWLTGSLEGITLPDTWNLRGILSVVFQLLGITYQNIRAHLVKLIPEPVVKTLETGFALVKTLVTEGPLAAWEQLKQIGSEMMDAFVEAVKDWIKWKVVQKAIETVISIFVPGAGIIRAVIGIYDTIVFFIQKAKQIIEMISNFLGSIAEIAAGNIAAAADALENGLARALKLVIAFLAKFLHLDGITKRIREAIQKVRARVDAVIEKVAGWIVGLAKKAGKFAVGAVKGAAARIFEWWKEKRSFDVEGKKHTLYFEGAQESAKLFVQSSPGRPISEYLADLSPQAKKMSEYPKAVALAGKVEASRPAGESVEAYGEDKIKWYNSLAPLLQALWGDEARPTSIVTFGPMEPGVGGSRMEAKILTRKHEHGTPPSEVWPLWETLQPLIDGPPQYVRGHLLNDNVGGRGQMYNLTPITTKANANHKTMAETHVKKWVAAGKVVYYKVKADYGGRIKNKGTEEATLEAKSSLSTSQARRLAALQMERKLARRIEFEAYVQTFKAGQWTKDTSAKETPIDDHVDNIGTAGY